MDDVLPGEFPRVSKAVNYKEHQMGKWDCTREDTWRDVMEWRARTFPDKLAFVSPQSNKQYTFSEFNQRTNKAANALLKLGLKKGERIGMISPDYIEYLEVAMTCKAGLVPVPVNWRLSAEEVAYILNDAGCSAVVIGQQYADAINSIKSKVPSLRYFICFDGKPAGYLNYHELLEDASDSDPGVDVQPADLMAIIYTSGTTGPPKGVIKKHGDSLCVMRLINGLGLMRYDDRALGVFPLFHAGLIHSVFMAYYFSACQWIIHKFDVEQVLQIIDKYKITSLLLVPTMFIRIMDHPDRAKYNTKSLRSIVYTGSPMPLEQVKKALDIFGPVLYQGFGMTEGCGQMSLSIEDHIAAIQDPKKAHLLKSVGKVLPGCEMILVDDNDKQVPRGETGEIVWRSRCMIEGYWKKPQASADLLRNGWLHTGDVGRLDEDGYLYIVDRKKDVIVSGGEKISSKELEDIIYTHPSVQEVAIVGVPSSKWGEEVKAVVSLKPGNKLTPDELVKWCEDKMGGFKRPRSAEIWPDLPKNASGKIMKKAIRERFWAGQEKRVG
jgi:acyl-CoA synthetase (AMP-forming)/AMP-acid ligase II